MRLSEWRTHAPIKDSVSPKVMAVVESAIETLGAQPDPDCWIVWGDDPAVRYLVFVPIAAGLIQLNVRVMVPGEGPRAAGKVVRWNRVQLGELAVEIQAGHRLVTFQAESPGAERGGHAGRRHRRPSRMPCSRPWTDGRPGRVRDGPESEGDAAQGGHRNPKAVARTSPSKGT